MRGTLFVCFFHFFCLVLPAQDTILLDPISDYLIEDFPVLDKSFYHELEYGREFIQFSPNKVRLEFCYYFDGFRNCHGKTYQLLDENQVLEDSIKWKAEKLSGGGYKISRAFDGFYEVGQAKSLFPIEKTGLFFTLNTQTGDTLWQEDYSKFNPRLYGSRPSFCYYYSNIEGPVYDYNQIDIPPTETNFASLKPIEIFLKTCYGDPYLTDITLMLCVITKEGHIVDIEQGLGSINLYCSESLKEIMLKISSWNKVNPAKIKGNAVNVRWFIIVDNLNRIYLHPVFSDTVENRQKVLKLKKRNKLNRCN